MNTAQKVVARTKKVDGFTDNACLAEEAEKEPGVINARKTNGRTPSRNNPYFKFVDGSSLAINHQLGDYRVFPK